MNSLLKSFVDSERDNISVAFFTYASTLASLMPLTFTRSLFVFITKAFKERIPHCFKEKTQSFSMIFINDNQRIKINLFKLLDIVVVDAFSG